MRIQKLKDRTTAKTIIHFLISDNAFDQTWAPGEKEIVKNAVFDSIQQTNRHYWYIQKNQQIIGAIGVRENGLNSGGYIISDEYFAIHKDHRGQGLGSKMLQKVEDYIHQHYGRYLIIETCDIESYQAARHFYKKNGYQKICKIPDYFVVGEGRIDYFKKF